MLSKKIEDKSKTQKKKTINKKIKQTKNISAKKENNKKITNSAPKINKKQNPRNKSIAFQLTSENLLSRLFIGIFVDILYVVAMLSAFLYSAQREVNGSIYNFGSFDFFLSGSPHNLGELLRSIAVRVYNNKGECFSFDFNYYGEFLSVTLNIIIIIQIIYFLFSCVFVPIRINRKLKPLYTMTEAAKALKNVDLTDDEFSTLQDAINKLSPNDPDFKLHTGKRELLGMEDAINDLLERVRNSYQSQIRFVSDASHELRTPIAVIQGYANMLERWGSEDKEILEESIASIKSEAENMSRLVENLLFLARGDSGRTVLRIESVDFNDLMCDIYDEFVMIDAEHEFRLDLRSDIMSSADSSPIKQCLRILVDNAIKYSPSGTDIILRLQKRDDNYFSIDVQDYGIGIKSEDASKIFDRFYRSDLARNRQNGGLGLGLSIAKWIADKHNAYFEVLSYENLGTRISLVMPFSSEKNAESEEQEKSNCQQINKE